MKRQAPLTGTATGLVIDVLKLKKPGHQPGAKRIADPKGGDEQAPRRGQLPPIHTALGRQRRRAGQAQGRRRRRVLCVDLMGWRGYVSAKLSRC